MKKLIILGFLFLIACNNSSSQEEQVGILGTVCLDGIVYYRVHTYGATIPVIKISKNNTAIQCGEVK